MHKTFHANDLHAVGTIEDVILRNGYDEAVLFVHVRFPDDVRKQVIILPAEQAITDGLFPGHEVAVDLHADGNVTYNQQVFRQRAAGA